MTPASYLHLVDTHIAKFKTGEKKLYDKVLRYYKGNFWTATDSGESEAELKKTSTNLVFAITETALSTLIPPNPQVSAQPRNPLERSRIEATDGIVNLALDAGKYRRELGYAVQNTVMYGLGVGKTVWDAESDLPVMRSIDPRNWFCDMTAQRPEDVRYQIEATILSKKQMTERVERGLYRGEALENHSPDSYPTWMLPEERQATKQDLRNYQPWYLVYEVYDAEENMVWHMLPGVDKPILEDAMLYNPYDALSFNYNGENIRGLSEIGLILANQEEYNWLETYLLNIQRHQVPRSAYDANAIDTEQAQETQQVPIGGLKPFRMRNGKTISELFAPLPMPEPGALAFDILARKREGISYVSALADAQRGQVVGAKTATELALIEGQLRNRLRARQARIDELTESVAAKYLLLSSRFMKKEKIRRITGSDDWQTIDPDTLVGVDAAFRIVPYSPMESNRAVRVEALRNMLPFLKDNPNIDQHALTVEIMAMLEMPATLVVEAPPPPGPPGAMPGLDPAAPPVDPAAANLPPQVQKIANANANAAQQPVAPGEVPMGGGPAMPPA